DAERNISRQFIGRLGVDFAAEDELGGPLIRHRAGHVGANDFGLQPGSNTAASAASGATPGELAGFFQDTHRTSALKRLKVGAREESQVRRQEPMPVLAGQPAAQLTADQLILKDRCERVVRQKEGAASLDPSARELNFVREVALKKVPQVDI